MNLAFDSDRGGRDQWVAWLTSIMAECRRVVKPGGYALVWALPRTSHWTGMALEEAGFALRDQISHLFGSGFPKSQSCLKPAHEAWWLAKAPGSLQPLQIDACRVATTTARPARVAAGRTGAVYGAGLEGGLAAGVPPTMQGRWPSNLVLSHIGGPDGCRPAGVRRVRAHKHSGKTGNGQHGQVYGGGIVFTGDTVCYADAEGYEEVQAWACVDGCPVKALDEQAGPRTSGGYPPAGGQRSHVATYGRPNERGAQRLGATMGSASRFFPTFDGAPEPEDAVLFQYCPKASRSERNAGCHDLPYERPGVLADDSYVRAPDGQAGDTTRTIRGNVHPCVKPLALMQWLVTLVARPGDLILDPFCGSGSTLVSCVREGMGFIGIDSCEEYVSIARRRVAHEQEQQTGPLFAGVSVASKEREHHG